MKKTIFKKHKLIFKMTLVAVFAALNFCVMLLPKIPIPSLVGKPYVHLGNLVVVLTSIFFGPVVGGLAGAIGMGIYDLISGYGIWTLKTVILKFGIGIVTGIVYKLIQNRKDKRLKTEMICAGSFFLLIALFTSCLAYLTGGSLVVNEVTINISWPLYVFSFILGLILVLSGIYSSLREGVVKAMYASTAGIIFNIFGELLGGFLKKLLTGNGVKVSLAMSIASIPATIINGCVVLFVVFLVFPGIFHVLNKITNEEDGMTETYDDQFEEDISRMFPQDENANCELDENLMDDLEADVLANDDSSGGE